MLLGACNCASYLHIRRSRPSNMDRNLDGEASALRILFLVHRARRPSMNRNLDIDLLPLETYALETPGSQWSGSQTANMCRATQSISRSFNLFHTSPSKPLLGSRTLVYQSYGEAPCPITAFHTIQINYSNLRKSNQRRLSLEQAYELRVSLPTLPGLPPFGSSR